MAKNVLGTIISIALKILVGNKKTAANAPQKTAPAKTSAVAPVAAASVSAGTLPKNVETIKFGPYDWRVLERKGDTALVITEKIVEMAAYHNEQMETDFEGHKLSKEKAPYIGSTWETSKIRNFLNGKFLEKFSPADTARIVEVTNQNPDNPWYKTRASVVSAPNAIAKDAKGGNPTKDKIFLLSIEEACRYFGDSTARLKNKGFNIVGKGAAAKTVFDPGVKPSLSFAAQISDQNDSNRVAVVMPGMAAPLKKREGKPFRWMLRSPGEADVLCATVGPNGCVKITGDLAYAFTNDQLTGVRPALWLKV